MPPHYYRNWAIATSITVLPATTLGGWGILAALSGGAMLSLGWAGLLDCVQRAIGPDKTMSSRILPAIFVSAAAGFFLTGAILWCGVWGITVFRVVRALG